MKIEFQYTAHPLSSNVIAYIHMVHFFKLKNQQWYINIDLTPDFIQISIVLQKCHFSVLWSTPGYHIAFSILWCFIKFHISESSVLFVFLYVHFILIWELCLSARVPCFSHSKLLSRPLKTICPLFMTLYIKVTENFLNNAYFVQSPWTLTRAHKCQIWAINFDWFWNSI